MSGATNRSWRRLLPSVGNNHSDLMDARTLHALAALLVLVQFPHLRNMPAWVSASGLLLVGARLCLLHYPAHRVLRVVLSPLSVTALAALSAFVIRWDYGYFVGRDPCVAFLFILVAAKFAEVRRANDATLLLCLGAFLLLTQYFYSQTMVSALITLPAVIALAYSLSVLRDSSNPESGASQLKLISVLLLQGLPIAALLFVVFPRLPGPLWSLPEDSMATTGLSDSMSPGSIGQLSQSGAVAFRVEFDDDVPEPSQLYWRGPVLTQFDGRNWALSDERYAVTPNYAGSPDNALHYTVTLQAHQQNWLFALDTAISLPTSYTATAQNESQNLRAIGRMYDDGQILANDTVSQTIRYRQRSVLGNSFPAAGEPASETRYLPGRNKRTIDFAKTLRSEVNTDREFAHRVLQHFNVEPFRYTLRPQLLGNSPVDDFMFNSREGFCEHYAAAFVVMMRAAGIPARVVTGYQGGEMNGDYMIVRQSNAHAWTEAYIDGTWQRFDPTSAVAPSRIEGGLAAALPNESFVPRMARHAPGLLRTMQLRWDAANHHWQRLVVDFDNDSQAGLWDRLGLGKPTQWQIMVVFLLFAGIWSAVVLRSPNRQSKKLDIQERYWQRLSLFLYNKGLPRRPSESPSEFLQRAATAWPSHQESLQQLDNIFTALRFRSLDVAERQTLIGNAKKELRSLRLALLFNRSLKPI